MKATTVQDMSFTTMRAYTVYSYIAVE